MSLNISPVELQEISPESIPENIGEFFRSKSSLLTDSASLNLEEFDELLVVNHENGNRTFVANHEKTYAITEAGTENLWYVADASPDNQLIGHGEIRLPLTDRKFVLFGKPFVGELFTKPEHRNLRRGNLLNRLLVMKEIAETRVNSPLYSDTLVSSDAKKVIKRFVRKGLAEECIIDDVVLYRSTQR